MTLSSKEQFKQFRERFASGNLPADFGSGPADQDKIGTKPKWSYMRFYFQWLGPFKGAVVLVFILGLTAALLGLIPPYATKLIIDRILQGGVLDGEAVARSRNLHVAGAAVLAILLVQQAIEAVRTYRINLLNLKVLRKLQQRLYDHLLRLPIHEIQEMKTGGIVTRVGNDVDDVSGLLQMAIITPGIAAFRVAATMVVLVCIQWRMAVVAVAILIPIVVINLRWIRKLKPLHRSIRRDRGEINARVVESFGGVGVVRVFRRERTEARNFALGQNVIIRKRLFTRLYYLAVSTAWGLLVPLASLLIIWYGGTRYLVGELTIGEIVAFQMYVFMLMMPISQIVQSWSDTQLSLAALERTVDIMNRSAAMPDRPGAVDVPERVETIRFEKVTFGYHAERPVLHGIDLTVRAGQTVALVGRSGAGKSTLTNLVARFYDPQEGAILLNGVDLRDVKLAGYRSLLGMVQQDVFLFDGTVRENIAYGRRGASIEEIIEAAGKAHADPFINEFPDGYDTLIGERGIKLSGGQKQRISIARAILADPQILILDEATSNLDTESEQLIQDSLVNLLADRTTFVIAHRLSTITRADLIVVMDRGRIIELGRHAELASAGGVYKEMVARQIQFESDLVDAAGEGIGWS
ncbi:MAG: ABC transporter ATP-binding protein [Phycisphaerae bacterium]